MKNMRLSAEMKVLVNSLNSNYKFTNEEKYADALHNGKYFLVNTVTHKTLYSWKTQKEAYEDMKEERLSLPNLPELFIWKKIEVLDLQGDPITKWSQLDLLDKGIKAEFNDIDYITLSDDPLQQVATVVMREGRDRTYTRDYNCSLFCRVDFI